MNEFEDIIYQGPSHVTTNVDYEYVEDENENRNNINNNSSLVSILKELVDSNLGEEIKFKPMVGGVTNTLFKSSFKSSDGSGTKSVIIRLYGKGSEQFIDRKTEANIQYLLSKNGVGPKFYGTFENGCIYGYLEGDSVQLEDLYDDHILASIAKETGRWHSLKLNLSNNYNKLSSSSSVLSPTVFSSSTVIQPTGTSLFVNLNSWIDSALSLVATDRSTAASLSSLGIDLNYYRDEAVSLMSFIEDNYNDNPDAINFCHNDLIPRNMIYNQEKKQVRFIDFEYSGYNYRGYDIGNFFCEFSGLELDYSKYPSIEIQKRFIKQYLISIRNCKNQQVAAAQQSSFPQPTNQLLSPETSRNSTKTTTTTTTTLLSDELYIPTEEEIHKLYIESNHHTLGSHLQWAFWGVLQSFSSTIDFDYLDYARKRFAQYDLVKNKVLTLK